MKLFTKRTLATMIATSGIALFANSANAGMVTDHHGNVGYDTYDECVAAVKDGSAKFYTPYTYQSPKRWNGEASVDKMMLKNVMIPQTVANDMTFKTRDYSAGACDLGVGQSNGRYGVSGKLVGKYVPFDPDMMVNVYKNSAGTPVRVSMAQCDNHFGDKFPTPVISEMKALPAQLDTEEDVSIEPVTIKETRTVRRSYNVKEVLMVPQDQIRRVDTQNGTAVAVQTDRNQAVVVGKEANDNVLNNVNQPVQVPVTVVPDVDGQPVVMEEEYVITE